MKKNDWNITRKQGEELLIEIIKNILEENDNVTIHRLCILMSKELNYNNIHIFRNGKKRNLNNYMKIEFEGIHSFLNKYSNLFKIIDNVNVVLVSEL